MTHRSKSTLFLIEQLIVIAVFAICAVACISILTAAYFYANDSKATSHAVLRAESAAEIFKATGGDTSVVAEIMGGELRGGIGYSGSTSAVVYYDSTWQVSDETNASYVLHLAVAASQLSHGLVEDDLIIVSGNILVSRITGEELVAFPVAVRGLVMRNS